MQKKQTTGIEIEKSKYLADIKKRITLELGYDSDLVINEADEKQLTKMNDIDRECIRDQRRTKREQLLQRYNLLRQKQAQMSNIPAVRVLNQSILSSDSSSSSSSSSSDSSSDGKLRNKKKPVDQTQLERLSSSDQVQIIKPNLLKKTNPLDCTLVDIKKLQLTREQIFQNLSSPFFDELVQGSFARVVAPGTNQYRMVKILSSAKCAQSYQVMSGGKQNQKQTIKIEFLIQHGKVQKNLKLNIFSNSEFTNEEFQIFKSACDQNGIPLPQKQQVQKQMLNIQKLLNRQWDPSELERLVAKRFEQKIIQKNFNQIANIPYEISRLNAELVEIRKQIVDCRRNDFRGVDQKHQIIASLEQREKNIKWMVQELEDHREGKVNQNTKLDEDVQMEEDPSVDVDINQEQEKLAQTLAEMQSAWQKRQTELDLDSNLLSVTERLIRQKLSWLECTNSIDFEIQARLLYTACVESTSCVYNSQKFFNGELVAQKKSNDKCAPNAVSLVDYFKQFD